MITIDSSSTSGGSVLVSSVTWSHTCSGIERVLVVGVGVGGTTPTGVTYRGVAMTLAVSETGIAPKTYLYYLNNPPTGAGNIVVTLASALGACICGGVSFNGVDSTMIVNTTAFANGVTSAPQVNIIPSVGNTVIIDTTYSTAAAALSPLAGQVTDWNVADVVNIQTGSSTYQSTVVEPVSVLQGMTGGGAINWSISAIALTPLLPKIMGANERSLDPTTPGFSYSFRNNVVGY